ncbi:MAG TPA: hypothetical protein VNA20_17285 [Frankiaceae bacterium]|nr:hypothetical protein [Frankiaceae bacterium]
MRRLAAVVALGVVTACGSSTPEPKADPTPTVSATASKKPKPKPKPKPSATKKPSPTPTPKGSPTAPPPATGEEIGIGGALLAVIDSTDRYVGDNCARTAPDLARATCTTVQTAGGTLLSVLGRFEGKKVMRLLVPTPDGYVPRYEGRDDGRSWGTTRVYATPLTGKGTDGVIFAARLTDGTLTYDVLTWVPGGPLVLRAHRGPLADGRLLPKDVALDEYERATDGSYVLRRLAWDGRRFRLSAGQRAAAPPR